MDISKKAIMNLEWLNNYKHSSLMDLNEAIELIDGTFDGYYEFVRFRRNDKNQHLYPKTTMKADKKALIEKIKEWEFKAKCWEKFTSMVHRIIDNEDSESWKIIQDIKQKVKEEKEEWESD
jgi:hypothetical protein